MQDKILIRLGSSTEVVSINRDSTSAVLFSTDYFTFTKVPTMIYQNMCDMCAIVPEHLRKPRILKYLVEFYSHNKPGKVIVDMIDLSAVEAEQMRQKYPLLKDIEWGMYVLLSDGHYDVTLNTLLLNSSQNSIENGNKEIGS